MMSMAFLTAQQRVKHRVSASPEDIKYLKTLKGNKEIANRHDEVDRVLNAHRNDLENIPIFFVAALCYLLTNPNPVIALNLFRLFTVCRCAHTFVYAICNPLEQLHGLEDILLQATWPYKLFHTLVHFNLYSLK